MESPKQQSSSLGDAYALAALLATACYVFWKLLG
jgi:hypothetical protein